MQPGEQINVYSLIERRVAWLDLYWGNECEHLEISEGRMIVNNPWFLSLAEPEVKD